MRVKAVRKLRGACSEPGTHRRKHGEVAAADLRAGPLHIGKIDSNSCQETLSETRAVDLSLAVRQPVATKERHLV